MAVPAHCFQNPSSSAVAAIAVLAARWDRNDERGTIMTKQSDIYRQNAENCMRLAEAAENEPAYNRFKRMEAAWLALADEQDWLDGETSPISEGALVDT
jgi:hypothetical protein